jgi:hypothetical protein
MLKFGIRAVYLIKSPRTLYWSLKIEIQRKDDEKWEEMLIDFFYTLAPDNTIYDYINYLNQAFKTQIDKNPQTKTSFQKFNWQYYPEKDEIELYGAFDSSVYNTYIFTVLDPKAFEPIGVIECDGWRVLIRTWDRETVLLKSTLTHQSENAHLGYTNTQYNPIKKYLINNPTPDSFSISTWVASTEKPVEFAKDGNDYIVLECVVEF